MYTRKYVLTLFYIYVPSSIGVSQIKRYAGMTTIVKLVFYFIGQQRKATIELIIYIQNITFISILKNILG
jgi:hypothetical protein